jgi:hypothetical protein
MTVRGTVSAGVEAGCLLFVPEPGGVLSGAPTGGPTGTGMGTRMGMGMGARRGPWVLVGRTAGIEAGSTVTVRGVPAPGMTTTCQQGTPFRVEAVVG